MKKYRVNYEAGESRYGSHLVDYMMVIDPVDDSDDLEWEAAHLYAEVEVEDDDLDDEGNETSDADDRHYAELVESVIAAAAAIGITREQLIFYRD